MKNVILFLLLILGTGAFVKAQQTSPTPKGPPTRDQPQGPIVRRQEEMNRRFETLGLESSSARRISNLVRAAIVQALNNLYRKPTKAEARLLAVGKEEQKKYARFLKQSDTGLTKLMADKGCAEYTSVLNVSEECRKFSMPGAGSSFSFRTGNYRIRRLSDLTFREGAFYSTGILSHAVMVNIGDVPLDEVTLNTRGLKFLNDFQPAAEFEEAKKIDARLNEGIHDGGFFYSRSLEAQEEATYALRVIAYRGSSYRAIQGFVYDELDFDERRDVTVAFRIVGRDDDSVTILWKILANQKSPSIKRSNEDRFKTEENKFVAEKTGAN
jgi:hypothetical protein